MTPPLTKCKSKTLTLVPNYKKKQSLVSKIQRNELVPTKSIKKRHIKRIKQKKNKE